MDAKRTAAIRKVLEATTAPPDVCTMGHGIFIVSGSTPRQVQADACFYRQAWGFVKELLDEVDQLLPACRLALEAAERCQERRSDYAILKLSDVLTEADVVVYDDTSGVSGSMDG